MNTEELKMLAAEFDKADIHWRAQSLTRDGKKALALAYLDARNVMDRLDQICGMENWQDRYEVHGNKTICYISIKIGDEWVTKSDGAGDTKVEAEKGSISDAFKRAAVKWGIGRYLYSLDAVWCPCETYERNGKQVFPKFTDDPWNFVRGSSKPAAKSKPPSKANSRDKYDSLVKDMRFQTSLDELSNWLKQTSIKARYSALPEDWKGNFAEEIAKQKKSFADQPDAEPNILLGG